MNPVNIIGMGMGPQDLSEQQIKIIEQADVLVGGRRLLEFFKASTAQKKSISKDIENVIDYVKNQMKTHNVVVLGALSSFIDEVSPEIWLETISDRVPERFIEQNRTAFWSGRESGLTSGWEV